MTVAWWSRPRRLTAVGAVPRSELIGRRSGSVAHELGDLRASRHRWSARWSEAAEGTGLAKVVKVAAGSTVSAPTLAAVLDEDLADVPTRLVIEMRPGQVADDYRSRVAALALALDAEVVTVRERGGRWIEIVCWDADPLGTPYSLPLRVTPGFLGITESGDPVCLPWLHRGHAVVQGMTGSGKSTFVYSMLATVAGAPDMMVAGVDPSGVLLRPFAGHPGQQFRASGLADDLAAARAALAALVVELDRRIGLIPDDADLLVPSPEVPLIVTVLEELPGLYRAADSVDRKVGLAVRSAVGRLISEGRKAAIRLVIVAQRADASVVDGSVRAQASLRLSFASDDDALRMLHPSGVLDGDVHQASPPGVALLSAPQLGHMRVRTPALPYRDYTIRVRAGGAS